MLVFLSTTSLLPALARADEPIVFSVEIAEPRPALFYIVNRRVEVLLALSGLLEARRGDLAGARVALDAASRLSVASAPAAVVERQRQLGRARSAQQIARDLVLASAWACRDTVPRAYTVVGRVSGQRAGLTEVVGADAARRCLTASAGPPPRGGRVFRAHVIF